MILSSSYPTTHFDATSRLALFSDSFLATFRAIFLSTALTCALETVNAISLDFRDATGLKLSLTFFIIKKYLRLYLRC